MERGARALPHVPWSILAWAFVVAPFCAGRGDAGGSGNDQEQCKNIFVTAPPDSGAAGCYALSSDRTIAGRVLYTMGDEGEVSSGGGAALGLLSVQVRFCRDKCEFGCVHELMNSSPARGTRTSHEGPRCTAPPRPHRYRHRLSLL